MLGGAAHGGPCLFCTCAARVMGVLLEQNRAYHCHTHLVFLSMLGCCWCCCTTSSDGDPTGLTESSRGCLQWALQRLFGKPMCVCWQSDREQQQQQPLLRPVVMRLAPCCHLRVVAALGSSGQRSQTCCSTVAAQGPVCHYDSAAAWAPPCSWASTSC